MHTCNLSAGEWKEEDWSSESSELVYSKFKASLAYMKLFLTNKLHYSFEIKSKQRQLLFPSEVGCPCGWFSKYSTKKKKVQCYGFVNCFQKEMVFETVAYISQYSVSSLASQSVITTKSTGAYIIYISYSLESNKLLKPGDGGARL